MKEQSINKVKLGFFVLTGTILLILGLYYIGSKKNLFHSTITVSANFNNVEGLMSGNNVRFNGIDVGTVSKVFATSDSTITVEFTIDKGVTEYITQNAVASIGTDGLLGNKLINIFPGKGTRHAEPLQDGSIIKTVNPIQMNTALRTLSDTNDNLKEISQNIKSISEKFNSNNTLWRLLTDTLLIENLKNTLVHIQLTSDNTAIITGDLSKMVQSVKSGKGTVGALLTDTSIYHKLNQTIVNIHSITDSLAYISGDLRHISRNVKNGEGAVGTILMDTTFVHNLNQSMVNIKNGSKGLDDNMEALKHSVFLRHYFKKKEKQEKKNKK